MLGAELSVELGAHCVSQFLVLILEFCDMTLNKSVGPAGRCVQFKFRPSACS